MRDPLKWSKYLNEALEHVGRRRAGDVSRSTTGRSWGNEEVIDALEKQRDMYKYIHDQTLRMANQGYTMIEIAEHVQAAQGDRQQLGQPRLLRLGQSQRQGHLQLYLGWFNGNPATCNELPPDETGKRYVDMMGGADSVHEEGQGVLRQG